MQPFRQYRNIGASLREQKAENPDGFHIAHHRSRDHDSFHRTLTRASSRANNDDSAEVEPVVRLPTRDNSSGTTEVESDADFGPTLDGIEVRDRTTKEGKGSLVFVVGWAEKDAANPKTWSYVRRFVATEIVGLIAFACMVASSIDSAVAPQAAEEFHVAPVVESFATGKIVSL